MQKVLLNPSFTQEATTLYIKSLALSKLDSNQWYSLVKNLLYKVDFNQDKIILLIKWKDLAKLTIPALDSSEALPTKPTNLPQIKREETKDYLYIILPISLHSKVGSTKIQYLAEQENPLKQALIQGYIWRKRLEQGKSIETIAIKANKDRAYIRRLIKLTYLPLATIESILDGRSTQTLGKLTYQK